MTPADMARIHAAAFTDARPWSETEITDLLASTHVTAHTADHGFALVRTVAREAELLTIAVDPAHQRKGEAHRLMRAWMADVPADVAFLEVAADNTGALRLYAVHAFAAIGTRPRYYARAGAAAVDAVLMRAALTLGQSAQTRPGIPESG